MDSNERWTTFVPMDGSTFSCGRVSKVLDRAVLEVWFDDDIGVVIKVYASGDFVGELSLLGEDGDVTEADLELVRKLEDLEVLSRSQRAALLARMSHTDGLRDWTTKHGLEKLLDLPFYKPMPSGLPESALRDLFPGTATVLEPTNARSAKASKAKARRPKAAPAASQTATPPKESWTAQQRVTLELHVEYWATVFSTNNWKLYNRYKKHLPADQRRDVDELCNAVGMGNEDEVADRVKSILARIWSCEDWDAVIRDPRLIDSEGDVWDAWLARLSAR